MIVDGSPFIRYCVVCATSDDWPALRFIVYWSDTTSLFLSCMGPRAPLVRSDTFFFD